MDKDCLIRSGPALTWMDARVSGRPVTSRAGKCCEINALWYFGLKKMEALARALGEPWECELAKDVRQSYQRFWNSETGCLFDVIDPEDASIRPNQIIAAAVPELLPMIKRKSILEVVTRDLLTPFGLRRSHCAIRGTSADMKEARGKEMVPTTRALFGPGLWVRMSMLFSA